MTDTLKSLGADLSWDDHLAYCYIARAGEATFVAFYKKVKELFAALETSERERVHASEAFDTVMGREDWLSDQLDAAQAQVAALQETLEEIYANGAEPAFGKGWILGRITEEQAAHIRRLLGMP